MKKNLEKKCDNYKLAAITIVIPAATTAGALAEQYFLKGNGLIGGIAGYMASAPLLNLVHSFIDKKYSLNKI